MKIIIGSIILSVRSFTALAVPLPVRIIYSAVRPPSLIIVADRFKIELNNYSGHVYVDKIFCRLTPLSDIAPLSGTFDFRIFSAPDLLSKGWSAVISVQVHLFLNQGAAWCLNLLPLLWFSPDASLKTVRLAQLERESRAGATSRRFQLPWSRGSIFLSSWMSGTSTRRAAGLALADQRTPLPLTGGEGLAGEAGSPRLSFALARCYRKKMRLHEMGGLVEELMNMKMNVWIDIKKNQILSFKKVFVKK